MIFWLKNFYLAVMVLSFSSITFANNLCKSSFDLYSSEDSDSTSSFLAYLAILFEEGILNLGDLLNFKNSLKNNSWINPIEVNKSRINSTNLIHYDEFEKYIHNPTLNSARVIHWIERFVAKNHLQEVYIQKSLVSTKPEMYLPMVLHPVQIYENQYLEIMSTPVTQYHWTMIMKANPSHFKLGYTTNVFVTNIGRKVKLQPNHPVENITKYSAMVFADELSITKNLRPFYGIVNSGFFGTEPLLNASIGALTNYSKLKFENSDRNGYRLPTQNEQEALQKLIFNNAAPPLLPECQPWVWSNANSNNQTQEVASLRPSIHEGLPFYDIYGNVIEWYADFGVVSFERDLTYGIANGVSFARNLFPVKISSNGRYNDVGFRLVRTISKEEYERKRK